VAVVGLRDGENLFLSATEPHVADAYIPAYVRRYPFVFATDQSSDRMILCIDRRSALFDENGGDVPLFNGAEPSEFTNGAMEFCSEFEAERSRTDGFVKLLRDLDLFEIKQAMFTPRLPDGQAGEPQMLAEYFAVSEEKMAALPGEKIAELFQNGALMQIYASMVSLLNWERLLARAMARPSAANDALGNA
jgi:hypothetical protein